MDFPHKEGQKCPAVDKECYQCHKQGHFARVCRGAGHLNETLRPPSHQVTQAVTLTVAQKRPSHFDRHNKVSTLILLFWLMGFP